jgi:hypothetical protein
MFIRTAATRLVLIFTVALAVLVALPATGSAARHRQDARPAGSAHNTRAGACRRSGRRRGNRHERRRMCPRGRAPSGAGAPRAGDAPSVEPPSLVTAETGSGYGSGPPPPALTSAGSLPSVPVPGDSGRPSEGERPAPKGPVETPPPEKPAQTPPPPEKPAETPPPEKPAETPPPEKPAETPPPEKPAEPPAPEPPAPESPAPTPEPAPEPSELGAPAPEGSSPESSLPFRFFSLLSPFNLPTLATAALDPNSAAIVKNMNEEIAAGKACNCRPKVVLETTDYSVPIYTVPSTQPKVKVTLPSTTGTGLKSAFSSVPVPSNAKGAEGTDKLIAIWQPSTNKLWEAWHFEHTTSGFTAGFGGAMEKVQSGLGVFGPESWPGANTHWGSSSCSFAMVGGLITLEDLRMGRINHGLLFGVPHPRQTYYSLPAKRTDGTSTSPVSIPEGAHFRIDPNFNLSSVYMPHIVRLIAEAAQKYGLWVCLRGPNFGVDAQDPTPTKTNPFTGPGGYFEGKSPEQLMAYFPWSHLQLLKMQLTSG